MIENSNAVERLNLRVKGFFSRFALNLSEGLPKKKFLMPKPAALKRQESLDLIKILDSERSSLEQLEASGYWKRFLIPDLRKGAVRICEARTLYALVRHFKCKRILEIGTARGFSALHFCKALKDSGFSPQEAFVHTIDVEDHRGSVLPTLKHEGLLDYFHFYHAPSETVLPTLKDTYDFCLIDGMHSYEQTQLEFSLVYKMLRPGGLIAFHDIYDRPPHESGPNTLLNEISHLGEVVYLDREIFDYFSHPEDWIDLRRTITKWKKNNYSYVSKDWDPRCLMAVFMKR